jgi:hypothetical protein
MYWHSTLAVYRLKNSVGRDSVQYLGQICLCNKRLWPIKIYSYEACFKVHTVEHLCNVFQIHSSLQLFLIFIICKNQGELKVYEINIC